MSTVVQQLRNIRPESQMYKIEKRWSNMSKMKHNRSKSNNITVPVMYSR